jgi:DNA polymerase elongation subunit (family B)
LVQKILLNSLYGVLGLPAFRFYDIDNAEAVTTTGRTVIQSTSHMANIKYNKELGGKGLLVEDTDGKTIIVYPNQYLKIERNGKEMLIKGKDLLVGDDIKM